MEGGQKEADWGGGRARGGRTCRLSGPGEGGDRIQHLFWILTPIPSTVRLAWAAQSCVSDSTGAALSSLLGLLGLTLRWPPAEHRPTYLTA